MQKSNIDKNTVFVCHMCQFKLMDPLSQPVATILRPFLIPKCNTKEAMSYSKMINRGKEFVFKENFYQDINRASNFGQTKTLKVQVRCLRLDGVGFEHMFPKFGRSSFNNGNDKEYRIPDPPNDQKKRHDEMIDLTTQIMRGRNKFDLY